MSEQRLLEWWLPPEGAGDPIACLATSFTFDTDFFRDDCLARFIGLRSSVGEEGVGSLAQINELEERLAEVTVCVLVDRSASVDGRNLRWDVVPIAVPGGLLHAKTAILIWEHAVRVIIGSANLTPAGYRYQREIAVAMDLTNVTTVPMSFWQEYETSMNAIMALVPPDLADMGPRSRAQKIISAFQQRIVEAKPPTRQSNERVKLVFSQPGLSAVDQLESMISGVRPRTMRAMSPFWDSSDQGSSDAVRALSQLLSRTGPTSIDLLVPLEATTTGSLVHAPRDLDARNFRAANDITLLGIPDHSETSEIDRRRLHAKALSIESDDYTIVMVGSSNMTSAGLGLHSHVGHIEMNVAYATPTNGRTARQLAELIPDGIPLGRETEFEAVEDPEEVIDRPALPLAFVSAALNKQDSQWVVLLQFNIAKLPRAWSVHAPGINFEIMNHETPGLAEIVQIQLPQSSSLPQILTVTWTDSDGQSSTADWVLNVVNPADLPLDERLRAIPVDLIIEALAQRSTNPSAALERLLHALSNENEIGGLDLVTNLDPLKKFDDSRALLKRIGLYGRALDELEVQLSRPANTVSALGWRLNGLVSPTRLAEGWADQCAHGDLPVEVAHFLFAELMLVINRIDWGSVTPEIDQKYVSQELESMKERWQAAYNIIPKLPSEHDLNSYVSEATRYQRGH